MQEFGIREVKEMNKQHAPPSDGESQVQYATTESQVRKEALNSASRIAGLVRFLSGNKQKDKQLMFFPTTPPGPTMYRPIY